MFYQQNAMASDFTIEHVFQHWPPGGKASIKLSLDTHEHTNVVKEYRKGILLMAEV
jgi:hypothetical protein